MYHCIISNLGKSQHPNITGVVFSWDMSLYWSKTHGIISVLIPQILFFFYHSREGVTLRELTHNLIFINLDTDLFSSHIIGFRLFRVISLRFLRAALQTILSLHHIIDLLWCYTDNGSSALLYVYLLILNRLLILLPFLNVTQDVCQGGWNLWNNFLHRLIQWDHHSIQEACLHFVYLSVLPVTQERNRQAFILL